jgi:hypothetical protein
MAGPFCYDAADPIIALYEANRLRQVADGAPAERTQNIPNGIALARFAPLRALRPAEPPPVLCLIGRVVPIKDIKTFIRAMRRVVNLMPEPKAGSPAGRRRPGLRRRVPRPGAQPGPGKPCPFPGLPEGRRPDAEDRPDHPVVDQRGAAAGHPRGLRGRRADGVHRRRLLPAAGRRAGRGRPGDRPSGAIVNIADPQALADAAVALLADGEAWQAASRAGIARVERYYTDRMMFDRYRQVYDGAFARCPEAR